MADITNDGDYYSIIQPRRRGNAISAALSRGFGADDAAGQQIVNTDLYDLESDRNTAVAAKRAAALSAWSANGEANRAKEAARQRLISAALGAQAQPSIDIASLAGGVNDDGYTGAGMAPAATSEATQDLSAITGAPQAGGASGGAGSARYSKHVNPATTYKDVLPAAAATPSFDDILKKQKKAADLDVNTYKRKRLIDSLAGQTWNTTNAAGSMTYYNPLTQIYKDYQF